MCHLCPELVFNLLDLNYNNLGKIFLPQLIITKISVEYFCPGYSTGHSCDKFGTVRDDHNLHNSYHLPNLHNLQPQ